MSQPQYRYAGFDSVPQEMTSSTWLFSLLCWRLSVTPIVGLSLGQCHRGNLSVRGCFWFLRYAMINLFLFVLLTFLTTPTIIITTIDKFNVTRPIDYLNVSLAGCHLLNCAPILAPTVVSLSPAEPNHQPVLPHPPAVVLLCSAAHHCLLFYYRRGPLEQVRVWTHQSGNFL